MVMRRPPSDMPKYHRPFMISCKTSLTIKRGAQGLQVVINLDRSYWPIGTAADLGIPAQFSHRMDADLLGQHHGSEFNEPKVIIMNRLPGYILCGIDRANGHVSMSRRILNNGNYKRTRASSRIFFGVKEWA